MVLLQRAFIVDAREQALVSDKQQRHGGRFVYSPALGFDDAVLDLIAHSESVASTDAIGFKHQFNRVVKRAAIQRNRQAGFESNGDGFGFDDHVFAPKRHAHDGFDDANPIIEEFEIFGFVRRAPDVGVG